MALGNSSLLPLLASIAGIKKKDLNKINTQSYRLRLLKWSHLIVKKINRPFRHQNNELFVRETRSMVNLRRWSDLPSELLGEIMKKLSLADQIRMLSVSRNWRQLPMEDDGLFHRLPWIVKRRMSSETDLVYEVYDPINTAKPYLTHRIDGVKPDDMFFCKEGWVLLLTENYGTGVSQLLLCRPTTRQIVVLPDIYHGIHNLKNNGAIISDFSFSSAPDSEGAMLFALYFDYLREKAITSTYKQGDKRGWITRIFSGPEMAPPFTSIVYHQGGFYYASYQGVLACYRVANRKWYSFKNTQLCNIIADYQNWASAELVGSPSDELLLVCLNIYVGNCTLFTFNWSLMKWTKKSHLEDQALFISTHSRRFSFVIPAVGCTADLANKIIFYKYSDNTIRFFNINGYEDQVCKDTKFDFLGTIIEWDPTAFWIEAPRFGRQHSAQRMDKVAELLKTMPGRLEMIPSV